MGPSPYPVAPTREPAVSRNKSFLRAPAQRPPHEVARRESHRMSAPPRLPRSLGDLPREYAGSSQSFLTDAGPLSENGDAARYYYPSELYYDNPQRQPRRAPDRFPEDYVYYEHGERAFHRLPPQSTPPAPSRPPSGKRPPARLLTGVWMVPPLPDLAEPLGSAGTFPNCCARSGIAPPIGPTGRSFLLFAPSRFARAASNSQAARRRSEHVGSGGRKPLLTSGAMRMRPFGAL